MFKNLLKNEKGFTLLELVIVIGIIAVISAIAMPSLAGRGKGANLAAHQANLNNITNAAESYAQEFEWVAGNFQVQLDDSHPIVSKGFLRNIPRNPWYNTESFDGAASNTYEYKYILDYEVIQKGLVKNIKPTARLAEVQADGTIAASRKQVTETAEGKESVTAYVAGINGF